EPSRATRAAELQSDRSPYSAIGCEPRASPARPNVGASVATTAIARHLHIDLDRVTVLGQLTDHLLVVLQPVDRRRQQLPEPARVDRLGLDQVVDTGAEVVWSRVDGADHDLVAEDEALIDLVRVDLGLAVAAGD